MDFEQHISTELAITAAGLGSTGGWQELFGNYLFDEVVAVSPWERSGEFVALSEACAERGVVFRQLVLMPEPKVGHYQIDAAGAGAYLISLETIPQEYGLLAFKRILDIVGAIVGLLVCSAIYLFYSIWIRLKSPGPVLFRQSRVGRNGRIFTLLKFRTMLVDAESRQHELNRFNEMGGALFKIRDDPRTIPGGRFMRRLHLDEFPQFWNVLTGDMSLVGTRPPTPSEALAYEERHRRRLSFRPGLTGKWQVLGNRTIRTFEEVVKLDCEYIDNWSLWLDLVLIAKTLIKITRADAY